MPRQATCLCGACDRCKKRIYMHGWYQRMTAAGRRAWVTRRDIDKVRAADRARFQRDKPKRVAVARALEVLYPDRALARRAVNTAVRYGHLFRQPCSVCGITVDDLGHKPQGHHINGYDAANRLNVVWLCQRHHDAVHHNAPVVV